VAGLELPDLGGHLTPERGGIEAGDRPDPRHAFPQRAPELLDADARGADGAETGDDDPSVHAEPRSAVSCWTSFMMSATVTSLATCSSLIESPNWRSVAMASSTASSES